MRHSTISLFTLLSVLLTGSFAHAGDLPDQSLLQRKIWVQFEIILGRITVLNPRHHEKTAHCGGESSDDPHEAASMRFENGILSLNYELTTVLRRVNVHVSSNTGCNIEQIPTPDSTLPIVRFEQDNDGKVKLTIDDGESSQVLHRPNLWQLLIAHEEVCTSHLLPLINLMQVNWRLDERAAHVRDAMFRIAISDCRPKVQILDNLIAQLKDPQFRTRQRADLQLRSYGQAVLSHLERLEMKKLDREQCRRIQAIRRDLICNRGDTAERVAMWLIDSESAWLDLVNHAELGKRQLATQHLTRIVDGPVEFDPAASDTHRASQLKELRTHLAER